jgi:hypothetical protein
MDGNWQISNRDIILIHHLLLLLLMDVYIYNKTTSLRQKLTITIDGRNVKKLLGMKGRGEEMGKAMACHGVPIHL